MKQLLDNLNYLDVVYEDGDINSIAKSSMKKVHKANAAVFLDMLDEVPYFLDYQDIEDPSTPGIAYTSVQDLYLDVLGYLRI